MLWTLLLLEPMQEITRGEKDRVEAASDFLEPIIDRLNVPRRIADAVRRIVAIYPRLESGRTGRFAKTPLFALAEEVYQIHRTALGHARQEPTGAPPADSSELRLQAPPPSPPPLAGQLLFISTRTSFLPKNR